MNINKQNLINAGKELCQKNLTIGTWGNISCRDPKTGYIYVTPSGMDYAIIQEEDIVVFDKDGKKVEGFRNPSIEYRLHILIYQHRPDVNAVIHTHPTYSTVFAVIEESIPPINEDFVQIVGASVDCADYALPGTEELAINVVKTLRERNAVLLKSHGTVCTGPDLPFAFKVCDAVEKTAYIGILGRSIGGKLRIIPEADILAMQEFVRTKYGQR
ncbi:MAG TPA: class II aldolase [Firmicutes bacterium]|jgi:L-fuculose-phosphate aldolase|nr:class II aldolase [Bacillota bacterium]